jgi:hypothetical protein
MTAIDVNCSLKYRCRYQAWQRWSLQNASQLTGDRNAPNSRNIIYVKYFSSNANRNYWRALISRCVPCLCCCSSVVIISDAFYWFFFSSRHWHTEHCGLLCVLVSSLLNRNGMQMSYRTKCDRLYDKKSKRVGTRKIRICLKQFTLRFEFNGMQSKGKFCRPYIA